MPWTRCHHDGELLIRTERVTDGVAIHVSDSGNGLTGEEIEGLSQALSSKKEKGPGLGLVYVEGLLRNMGVLSVLNLERVAG